MVYEQLRDYVHDEGIKYKAIAEKTGMKINTISSIMLGQRKMSVEEFIKICDAIHAEPVRFLTHKREA